MHYSLWLIPAPLPIIDDLSEIFDAVRFLPHVTVLEAFERTGPIALHEPIELVFDHLECTADSIRMRARPDRAFSRLAEHARSVLGGDIPAPHLSLAYFPHDPEGARGFAFGMLDFPLSLRFDALEFWDTRGELSVENVRSWSRLKRVRAQDTSR